MSVGGKNERCCPDGRLAGGNLQECDSRKASKEGEAEAGETRQADGEGLPFARVVP